MIRFQVSSVILWSHDDGEEELQGTELGVGNSAVREPHKEDTLLQKQNSNGLGNDLYDRRTLRNTEKGQASLPQCLPAARHPLFYPKAETTQRAENGRVERQKGSSGPRSL